MGGRTKTSGQGRPKGSQNKYTRELREMILNALDQAGGVSYLRKQAIQNPASFMGLLGKVLPMQVTGKDGGPIVVTRSLAEFYGSISSPDAKSTPP